MIDPNLIHLAVQHTLVQEQQVLPFAVGFLMWVLQAAPTLLKFTLLFTTTYLIAKDKLGTWWYGIILLTLFLLQ